MDPGAGDIVHAVLGRRLTQVVNASGPTNEVSERRLSLLAEVTQDLKQGYGTLGARWWLERPAVELGGRTPADLLASGDCQDALRVRSLVRSFAA